MYFIFIFMFTTIGILKADDAMNYENLECFNDYDETLFCRLTTDESKCTGYNMEFNFLSRKKIEPYYCTFEEKKLSDSFFECKCSIDQMILIVGEEFNATLSHSGKQLESRIISISDSIKLKAPTVKVVEPSGNRNFLVKWETNYEKPIPCTDLKAEMSYRRKGESNEVSLNISSNTHEILGRDLEPNSIYSLKIRTYCNYGHRFSDWSEEFEFSHSAQLFQIVIFLICIAIVILTIALFWCAIRLKTKWWDNIPKCSKPDILYMVPGVPKVLDPHKTLVSPIYFDSSITEGKPWTNNLIEGSSRGFQEDCSSEVDKSSMDYAHVDPERMNVHIINHCQNALKQVFDNLGNNLPASSTTDEYAAINSPESNKDSGVSSPDNNPVHSLNETGGSSSYNNMTYSVSLSSSEESEQNKTSPCSAQPRCDNVSHHSNKDVVLKSEPLHMFACTAQPDVNLSTNSEAILQTDFSYGTIVGSETTTSAEDSCLTYDLDVSNMSTPHNVISVVDIYQPFGEALGKDNVRGTDATMPLLPQSFQNVNSCEPLTYDMNPCYQSLTDRGCSLAPSEDDYQALPNLGLDQKVSEQHTKEGKPFDMSVETENSQSSLGSVPLNFIPNSQGGQFLTFGSPFINAFSTDQAIQMENESDYHCL
ncbi:hypothetical protein UPYG_G00099230 [Umbra pygmaea]|uniref:Fibronectin type-III domain-containing protein n=1 Tax=Umbra pygmaea TaxID=75934 RepID=A0ABD0X4D1_UMBPY